MLLLLSQSLKNNLRTIIYRFKKLQITANHGNHRAAARLYVALGPVANSARHDVHRVGVSTDEAAPKHQPSDAVLLRGEGGGVPDVVRHHSPQRQSQICNNVNACLDTENEDSCLRGCFWGKETLGGAA
jgi:hypothetical protein